MKKNNLLILFLLLTISVRGQQKNAIFNGKVVNDSVSVENIHVINKNNRRVALTNRAGEFEIPVQLNDTLVFSAVQFEPYQRIVVPQDLQKLQVIIRLKIQTNQLSEVRLERNNIAIELGLPNAEKKPKTKLEARIDGHSKASLPVVILTTIIGGAGGIDNLYYILSGQRKKDRKLQKLLHEDKIRLSNEETIKKIKKHFKKDFFIYTLNIPVEEIDNFIDHCNNQNVIALFKENRKLEVTEIFLQQSENFLKEIKE